MPAVSLAHRLQLVTLSPEIGAELTGTSMLFSFFFLHRTFPSFVYSKEIKLLSYSHAYDEISLAGASEHTPVDALVRSVTLLAFEAAAEEINVSLR